MSRNTIIGKAINEIINQNFLDTKIGKLIHSLVLLASIFHQERRVLLSIEMHLEIPAQNPPVHLRFHFHHHEVSTKSSLHSVAAVPSLLSKLIVLRRMPTSSTFCSL